MAGQTQAELLANLADARAKYHLLVTGSSVREFVDQNGERVAFTQANRADLFRYIQELERMTGGDCAFTGNRPARFIF